MKTTTLPELVDLTQKLDSAGYIPDDGLVAAAFLAEQMNVPLFLEGDPGVGKTAFAQAMAVVLDARLIRLQCYGGIDAPQALYDWDFARQVLTLRALGAADPTRAVRQLYSPEFLVRRPILDALVGERAVLLIDEIDRADDEFEALLLEVLENSSVNIPEIGEIRAAVPPLVILTSNQTREVHDALKRRCLYHWIDHPSEKREVEILCRRVEGLPGDLAREIAAAMKRLRDDKDLAKIPGVAESINLARAVLALRQTTLTPEVLQAVIGAIAKSRDDWARMRDLLLPLIPEQRRSS